MSRRREKGKWYAQYATARPCIYCGHLFRPIGRNNEARGKVCPRPACEAQSRNATNQVRRMAERLLKHFRQPVQPSHCPRCGTTLRGGTDGDGHLVLWCPEGCRAA